MQCANKSPSILRRYGPARGTQAAVCQRLSLRHIAPAAAADSGDNNTSHAQPAPPQHARSQSNHKQPLHATSVAGRRPHVEASPPLVHERRGRGLDATELGKLLRAATKGRSVVSWDDVDMADEAKVALQAAGVKASVGKKLDSILGVHAVGDLAKLDMSPGSSDCSVLELGRMQEEALREMVVQIQGGMAGGRRSSTTRHVTSPSAITTRVAEEIGPFGPRVVRICDDTANLWALSELLAAAKEPTIFDLGGRTLEGPLPPRFEGELLMSAPGTVLRGGKLLLPEGAELVMRGQGSQLEDITVWGCGKDKWTGVVWLDGIKDAVLQRCCIVGRAGSSGFDAVVWASNGATATLSACYLAGSGQIIGLYVQEIGSSVVMRDTKVHGTNYWSVAVMDYAFADLYGCNVTDGISVQGSKSRLVAQGCTAVGGDTNDSAVYVSKGGAAELFACTLLQASSQASSRVLSSGPTVNTADVSSSIKLYGCKMDKPTSTSSSGTIVVM